MSSARVLIIEDEPEWRSIVRELLTDDEHFCYTADSYESALALIRQESFNVVFLDLILHEFDKSVREGSGWRLLNYLVEQHPRTKIAILSGRATAGEAVRLMRNYPVMAFIDKSEPDVEAQIVNAVNQAMQVPSLRVQSFGQFSLWRDRQVVNTWESPEAKLLIKLLLARLVEKDRAVSADKLVEWLWPGVALESSRQKLLPVINSARLTLEPNTEPRDSNFILRSADGYYFNLGNHVTWDVHSFRGLVQQAAAQQLQGELQGAITAFEAARALYTDDFLIEDRGAPWATPARQSLQTEYRDVLSRLAEAYAAQGRFADAIQAGEAALKVDPLLESVYRQLMRYHYAIGKKDQALKVYRNCEKLFGELFGEDLTPQTKQLFELISADARLDSWGFVPPETVAKPG